MYRFSSLDWYYSNECIRIPESCWSTFFSFGRIYCKQRHSKKTTGDDDNMTCYFYFRKEPTLSTIRTVVLFTMIYCDIHRRFPLMLIKSLNWNLFHWKAFSHFTFEASCHQLIVVDIQGVGDLYTDPQIHTSGGIEYGGEKTSFFDIFGHIQWLIFICRR